MSSTFLSYCNNNEEVIVISDEEENKVEGLLNEIQGHHHGEGHTNRQHDDEEEQGSSDDEAQKTSSDDDNDDNDDHVQVIHSMIHSHTGGDENDETFLLHQFVIRNEQDHSLVALNDLLQDNDSKEIRKTHSIVYGRVIQVKNELPSHICIDMDTLDGIDALDEWISEKTEPANASEKIGYLLDVRVEYELCTRPILIFTIDRSNGSIECECLDPSDEYIEMYEKVYQRSCICHCLIESISTYPLGTYSKIMSAAKEFSQSLGVTITNSILLSHFSFIVNQFYRLNDPLILNSKFMIELTSLKLKGDSIEDDHLSSDNDELYEEENQTFKKPLTLNTKKRKQYSNVTRKHFKRKKQLTNSSPNSNDTQFSLSYLYDSSQNNIIGFEINGQTILEGESIYILPHEHLFPNFMRGNIDKSYPYLIYRVEFKGLEKSIYGRRLYRHYDMAFMCLGSDKNILTHDVHELMISSENVIELPIQNYFIRKCFVFYLTSAEEFVEISNDIRERRDVFYCISSVTISNSFKSYQLSPIDQLYITRMFELIDRYAEYLYENLIIELGCKKPLKGMDVFSGCGGLSYGLHKAGIQICYAVDSSIDAINNYQLNFKSSNTFQKNASKFLRKIKMINKLREICGMNYEMTSDDTLHPTNGTTSSRNIHNTINSDSYANNSITNNQKSSSTILKIKKFRVHHDRMEFKVIWDNTILKNKQWIYFSQLQQQAPNYKMLLSKFLEKKYHDYPYQNEIDVLVGGPPCQGFSLLNRKKDNTTSIMSQEKNKQILTFINFVDYFKPKYVLMENVTGMLMNSDVFDVPKFIISKFKDIGYDIRISVFNAIHFGIPQSRSRLFFLGQRTSTTNLNTHCTIQFPIPTHAGRVNSSVPNVFKSLLHSYPNAIQSGSMPPVNLRDYICDLKPLEENDSHPRNVNSDHHSKDVNHSYPREALTVYQKIARRGCGRLTNMEYREYNNSFLTKSVIRCLPRRSGATIEDLEFDSLRIAISKKQKSKKSFKRLEWSKPSSCIVSNMSVTHFEFIHPTENRILSIRECARIQGFPDTFEFVDDQGPLCRSQKLKEKYTQIGNAVPVIFGFQFGIEIRKAFIKSTQPNDHSMVQHHISIISEQLQRILKESSENANRTIAEWSEQDFEISNDLREGTTLEFRKAEKEFHNSDEFVSQFLNVQLEQPSSSLSMDEDSDDHMVENAFEGSPLV